MNVCIPGFLLFLSLQFGLLANRLTLMKTQIIKTGIPRNNIIFNSSSFILYDSFLQLIMEMVFEMTYERI